MSQVPLNHLLKIGSAALQTTATTLCEAVNELLGSINELIGKIPTVARTTAAASSTVIKKQQVKVGSTDYDIDGTAYMEQDVLLSTADVTIATFTNAAITTDSDIEVSVSDWSCVPENVSATTGTCAVTLPKVDTAATVRVRIYIR